MLYLNADPAVKVSSSLYFTIVILQTLITLQQQIVSNATSTSIDDATKRDEYPLEQMQRNAKRPPMNGTGGPSRVLIGIYIESMGNFQAADMSFDVDLYLYSHWRDPSLKHNNDDYVLMTDPKVRERIWLPDLYFANARTSKFHDVTIPNFSLFIDRDGNIAYSTRVTLNVACNLELANYPMDSQRCGIRMVSYAYVASQVNVSWFKIGATRYNPEIGLPEFKIVQLTPESCDGSYMYAIMSGTFKYDKFSCLEAVIHLNRQIGYHVVQSFIPTGLIVMISWVSFWIDRRAVPARVTLSFTTLLSLSTLGNGLRFNLPQVAYAKAIDFWFGSCMFFVFLSLVEFAAVNSYMREAEKYERLASYSAKKEMTNEEGNPWVYSDDDDFSSASRSPVLPFPSSHQKNSKKKSANNKSPKLNANNKNDYNNNNKKDEQENETKAIGAKLHNWTSNAIAIPSLFGRCADGGAAGDTKRSTTHNQQQQNGRMRMIRHPTILAERILTVEHFEQLAEKRMSNSSQGKQSATRGEQHHPQHNHQLKQQQYASPVAAFEADLRSIDADENDSLLLMLSASSPAVPQRKSVISPLAKGGVTSALPPPPPPAPAPAFHCPPVPTMNRNGEGSPGGRNRAACTPTPTMSRKRSAAVTPVPTIQPWPPSPMAQDANHKTPPAAPRRKEQQSDAATKEAAVPGPPDHLLMATTNHFLREGFRYSRKGLFIDKWSRLLFPLAFALWNTYYWTYYLWYIQRHHQGSGSGGGG
ncbi:hypothetical protein niasHT_031591 [Heterodera trifolii]|uniref:Uncharacterized protein n=1 Tax=Heterodera trifolii TaxID=157864 RepID=A0ABD2IZL0_9BILA